jgi:sarcosine oxidase delta subunit
MKTQEELKILILFYEDAWEHYIYWQNTDKNKLNRINTLIKDCRESFRRHRETRTVKRRTFRILVQKNR